MRTFFPLLTTITGRPESTTASLEHWLKGTSAEQMLAHTGAWTWALHLSLFTVPPSCIRPPISPLPSSTYHLVTCPLPGTSAAGSAGSGCGWYGRSGSSSDGGRSRLHCSADSSWRSPAQEKGMETTQVTGWTTMGGKCSVTEGIDSCLYSVSVLIKFVTDWLWFTLFLLEIFLILLLPNRLNNNTAVMVFSRLLHCSVWHSKSAVFHQCVQHEGGVFG